MIKKKPFVRYKLDEEKVNEKGVVFTVYMNNEEYADLKRFKILLDQPKDSTTLKQLAEMGKYLLEDKKIALVIGSLFKNKRNNKRMGINIIE